MKDLGAIRRCGHHITSASVSLCLTGEAERVQTRRKRGRSADSCQICSVNDTQRGRQVDGDTDGMTDGIISSSAGKDRPGGTGTHGGTGASVDAAAPSVPTERGQ